MLQLLQLVPEQVEEDVQIFPHAVLAHALELKPYIEEPELQHEFVLTKQDTVDLYWETLEYCYATADPESAKPAFADSAAPEVCVLYLPFFNF